jgi:hypothetical protein
MLEVSGCGAGCASSRRAAVCTAAEKHITHRTATARELRGSNRTAGAGAQLAGQLDAQQLPCGKNEHSRAINSRTGRQTPRRAAQRAAQVCGSPQCPAAVFERIHWLPKAYLRVHDIRKGLYGSRKGRGRVRRRGGDGEGTKAAPTSGLISQARSTAGCCRFFQAAAIRTACARTASPARDRCSKSMRMRRDWESPAKPPKRRQRNSEGLKKERLTFRTCCPPSSAKMLFVNTAVRAVRFRNALCVSSVQLKIRLRSNAYGCASRACSSAVSCAVSCATSCESELQSRLGSSLTIREFSLCVAKVQGRSRNFGEPRASQLIYFPRCLRSLPSAHRRACTRKTRVC